MPRCLRKRWDHFESRHSAAGGGLPGSADHPGRADLVVKTRDEQPRTNVTVLLPRRTYSPLLGRLLHDRTADKIARAVSLIPDAAATIVPYDVESRIKEAYPDVFEHRIARELDKVEAWVSKDDDQEVESYEHPKHPVRSHSVITVAGLIPGQRATFEGRVNEVEDSSKGRRTLREVIVGDNSGEITVTFRSGHGGADIQPGQLLRITGKPRQSGNRPMWMVDPAYHVVEEPAENREERETEIGDREATSRPVGVNSGFLVHRQRLSPANEARLRLAATHSAAECSRRSCPCRCSGCRRPRWRPCGGGCRRGCADSAVLVSTVSWLGLLGLRHIGGKANEPLTAALDAGLGPGRRTESGDLWKRPALEQGATAKKPGVVRMLRIYRDYAHDGDSATATPAPETTSTSGDGPTWPGTGGRRCCCRCPVAPG